MYEYEKPVSIRVWFVNGKSKIFENIKYTSNANNSCLMVREDGKSIMLNWANINFIEEE
jgi:hypothetical protein